MLLTESILYHTCKNLLSTESIDSCMVSVDSQFTSVIYRYCLCKSCNSRSTSILHSITSRGFWHYPCGFTIKKSLQKTQTILQTVQTQFGLLLSTYSVFSVLSIQKWKKMVYTCIICPYRTFLPCCRFCSNSLSSDSALAAT